ncbi:hypothetical protein PSPO01_08503 [Paraphaeosphaeria sporulosa]
MSLKDNFGHMNIQNGPLYDPKSGCRSTESPNTREWLPGMDIDHVSNNRRKGYATMKNLTPREEQERDRYRAAQERVHSHCSSAQTMDQGVRFGVPSMGFRTGAHQTMGDRPARLRTWDHRSKKAEPPDYRNSTGWGNGPAFRDLRIGEQNQPACPVTTCPGQSPYPPGMQVDNDRFDHHIGRLQLVYLYSPHSILQHSQPYPPGMKNAIQSVERAFANLLIVKQEASNFATTINNGNPHLPGMGYRHVFRRGREDM